MLHTTSRPRELASSILPEGLYHIKWEKQALSQRKRQNISNQEDRERLIQQTKFRTPPSRFARDLYRLHVSGGQDELDISAPSPISSSPQVYNEFKIRKGQSIDSSVITDMKKENIDYIGKFDEEIRNNRLIEHIQEQKDKKEKQRAIQQCLDDQLELKSAMRERERIEKLCWEEKDIISRSAAVENRTKQIAKELREESARLMEERKKRLENEKNLEREYIEKPIITGHDYQIRQNTREMAKKLQEENLKLLQTKWQQKHAHREEFYPKSNPFW